MSPSGNVTRNSEARVSLWVNVLHSLWQHWASAGDEPSSASPDSVDSNLGHTADNLHGMVQRKAMPKMRKKDFNSP